MVRHPCVHLRTCARPPWSVVYWVLAKPFLISDELAVALQFVGIAINLSLVTRWAFPGSLPTATVALSRAPAALYGAGTSTLAKAVLRPIALGVVAYFATVVAMGFFALNVLHAGVKESFWLLTGAVTLPLIVSGYVGARFTVSAFRARRVVLGVASALLGYATPYIFIDLPASATWMLIVLVLEPTIAAAVGAWLGTVGPSSKASVGRTPDA